MQHEGGQAQTVNRTGERCGGRGLRVEGTALIEHAHQRDRDHDKGSCGRDCQKQGELGRPVEGVLASGLILCLQLARQVWQQHDPDCDRHNAQRQLVQPIRKRQPDDCPIEERGHLPPDQQVDLNAAPGQCSR